MYMPFFHHFVQFGLSRNTNDKSHQTLGKEQSDNRVVTKLPFIKEAGKIRPVSYGDINVGSNWISCVLSNILALMIVQQECSQNITFILCTF